MIYFVTCREVNRVKIGSSNNPFKRRYELQMFSPLPVVLEKVALGGLAEEKWLHNVFADAKSHGEWFYLTPEIEAWMQTCDDPALHEKPRVKIEPYTPHPFWHDLDISPENVSAEIAKVGNVKAAEITGLPYGTIRNYRIMRTRGKDNIRGLIIKALTK